MSDEAMTPEGAAPPPPADAAARAAALAAYAILDTPTEPAFDDIVRLAAEAFDAPIAVVNLVAADRQWFKAETGIGVRELPLDVSICAHAILDDELLVVPDTRADARFAANPLVAVEGGLRFYAGALLRTAEGIAIGTVCVLDRSPRPAGITAHQRLVLEVLARQAMVQLDLRRVIAEQAERARELADRASEQAAARTALRISEDRYRSLFDSLDAGFCVIEMAYDAAGAPRDYRFVEINPAFAAQTGLDDAVGRWMRQLAPDHEQHWFDIYGEVATTGVAVRFENAAAALDGRWYDVHAFRMGAADDHQVAVLFTDISARRRAELALAELNATLETRVAEAVAEREAIQDTLRQSQKLEAIGQLTGGVAHDFNNLLTVIRGSVDLLRRPGLPETRRETYLAAIGDTADRAAALTGQLLAFARRQALSPTLFDAGHSLREVARMIATLAGSRIELDLQVPDEPFHIVADRSQFDTAIVNLGINARDAMGGAGRLTIAARPVAGIPAIRSHAPVTGDFVAVTIADTGSGIPAADLGRIFEPFYTTKPLGEGTGLGLSQVIGFAKQSDGDIGVESREGEGTAFTLYLPRAFPDWVDEHADAGAAAGRADGTGICVLVVEDNRQVGDFAQAALKELGYGSVLAVDGAEALAAIARSPDRFQIVFSDVVMPGMSGVELGEAIRARRPDLPIVLTSGYSHVLAQNSHHGFELLHKPYSIEQLSHVLQRAIAFHRGRPAPAA